MAGYATAPRLAGDRPEPVLDVIDPGMLTGPKSLITRLNKAGAVGRWRNPDLWDGLATSIIRQVSARVRPGRLLRTLTPAVFRFVSGLDLRGSFRRIR